MSKNRVLKGCSFYMSGGCKNQNCQFMHAVRRIATIRHSNKMISDLCAFQASNQIQFVGAVVAGEGVFVSDTNLKLVAQQALQCTAIAHVLDTWVVIGYDDIIPISAVSVGKLKLLNMIDSSSVDFVISADSPYAHCQTIRCVRVVPLNNDFYIFSGGDDCIIRMWKTNGSNSELVSRLDGHFRGILSLLVVGSNLWSSSADHTIRVWDLNTMQCRNVLSKLNGGHDDAVTCLFHLPERQIVISGSSDSTIKIWNEHSFEMVQQIAFEYVPIGNQINSKQKCPIIAMQYALDAKGQGVVVISSEKKMHFLSAKNGAIWFEVDLRIPIRKGTCMISGINNRFFVGDDGGSVNEWIIEGSIS